MPQIDKLIDIAALKGITLDSRAVKSGYLFAALKGEQVDGRDYIGAAIKNGASIVLTDAVYEQPEGLDLGDAILVKSENPARDISYIAAEFNAPLPEHFVAVTGTNGKSSVVHFASQLWQKEGVKGVMMGTLTNALTTPDAVTLFEALGILKNNDGITHVAIETSSHGLAQHRADGAPIKIAAFTNFTQDHLDYHESMDEYFSAKKRLFEELVPEDGAAVLNADVPSYKELSDICKRRGVRVISYGEKGEDLTLLEHRVVGVTQEVVVDVMGQRFALSIPFVGAFQVMNMLCSLGCLLASSTDDTERIKTLTEFLPTLQGVPGRLQQVSDPSGAYNGYVDYAHTPDALETVLNALRPHTKGRLVCVFGCGGDRDSSKRPQMGEIAARLADVAIITDDNPRSESPSLIRKEIEDGIPDNFKEQKDIQNIEGRRKAIEQAVALMQKGDILLLAGKGHEDGQTIGDKVHPFDDATELNKALRNRKSTAKQIERNTQKGMSDNLFANNKSN